MTHFNNSLGPEILNLDITTEITNLIWLYEDLFPYFIPIERIKRKPADVLINFGMTFS